MCIRDRSLFSVETAVLYFVTVITNLWRSLCKLSSEPGMRNASSAYHTIRICLLFILYPLIVWMESISSSIITINIDGLSESSCHISPLHLILVLHLLPATNYIYHHKVCVITKPINETIKIENYTKQPFYSCNLNIEIWYNLNCF